MVESQPSLLFHQTMASGCPQGVHDERSGFSILGHIGSRWLILLFEALFHLALFIFWLIAIVKAGQGERYHIPGVGDLAENLASSVSI